MCLRPLGMPSRYRPARTLWRLDDACWTEVWDDRSQTGFKRLFNVGQQVIRILDAGGIAHQAIMNPQPLAFLRRQFVVRHQCRLFHQAFHPTQARGDVRDTQRIDEGTRLL